ncbi:MULTISPECIES: serine hydrolase domain-containing protein [Streptomyces]|uniref:serine hydrolase domain-containing protein n=1 Tax=Streptomyces TaxID=1883 RepID=UPI0022AEFBD6|nr:serine hydrolase domain-containing protein [Streptomyces sp. H39-C1]MCZ4101572.1 serine hydrolase [Streptomyces sp. H39-C1]
MRPARPITLLRLAAATALLALCAPVTTASGAASDRDHRHRPCVSSPLPGRGPARDILRIAEQAKAEMDLKSVILRVTVDGREVITTALGESMTGVPAEPAMHFRNGNVAISYMGTALLRLVDEGRVDLDDPVARWLPDLPHGHQITLRMLGASTSGLIDYVTSPGFSDAVYADPFRQWTAKELVAISTSKPLWYEPGTNWSYSHANFVLLGAALEKITGTPLDVLLQQQVMGPLGLSETRNSFTPDIPTPVLHAFTSDRGKYEESSFWNPSWTTAPGAVQTTDICDLARTAAGIGSGELLSPAAYQEMLNPGTVGLGRPTKTCPATICIANTEATHYGMGLLVLNDWVSQHPLFFGYTAAQAYLPAKHLAIAVSTTTGPKAPDGHTAQTITQRIAAALVPDHPIPDFG